MRRPAAHRRGIGRNVPEKLPLGGRGPSIYKSLATYLLANTVSSVSWTWSLSFRGGRASRVSRAGARVAVLRWCPDRPPRAPRRGSLRPPRASPGWAGTQGGFLQAGASGAGAGRVKAGDPRRSGGEPRMSEAAPSPTTAGDPETTGLAFPSGTIGGSGAG